MASENQAADYLNELKAIHSALDDALGDSDVTHVEDDVALREDYPSQWAAMRLAKLISEIENNLSEKASQAGDAWVGGFAPNH